MQPTSGKQWRRHREEGVPFTLPSGHTAYIRSVGPEMMFRLGKLPTPLRNFFAQVILEPGTKSLATPTEAEQAEALLDIYDAYCRCALVNPRIVDNPTADDEIAIDDLTLEDKMAVYALAQEPMRHLENFREEQTGPVGGVASEPTDPPDSGGSPEPFGVGGEAIPFEQLVDVSAI